MALTQSPIEKKLSNEHLDELLELWQTEQGAAKRRDLELMAAALPFRWTNVFGFWTCAAVRAMSVDPFGLAIRILKSIASIVTCFSSRSAWG